MSNILIIGGSRFLGPEIIGKFLKNGDTVTIFNRGNNYGQKIPKKVKQIKGDRLKPEDLKQLKKNNYDYIFDMCCFNLDHVSLFLGVVKPKSHIVFLSSAAAYEKPRIFPLYEESKLGEWSTFGDYGVNKAKAEKTYSDYCKKNDLKLTILRPNYLLGKNDYFDRENYFFSRILRNKPILLPGKGDAIQQFGFLDDTAQAFFKIPRCQKNQIEIVNIAGNDLISLRDFILLCGEIAGKKPNLVEISNGEFGIFEDRFYDALYPFPNITFMISNQKMVTQYGINPIPLENGLKNIYKFWLKNWDGKVKIYEQEEEILKKLRAI